MGTEIGNSWIFALGWCVSLALIGFVWARRVYDRTSGR